MHQGALGNDTDLAGAVWRNIFEMNCTDVSHVELMVDYIRRQVGLFPLHCFLICGDFLFTFPSVL